MTSRRWPAIVLGVLVAFLAVAAGGGAAAQGGRSATRAEVADLAARAVDDDGALTELRSIGTVDGHRVDLGAVTASFGSDRAARLDALAAEYGGTGAPRPTDASSAARRRAERVLEDDKFHEQRLPKPFKRPLRWLADRLRPVGRALRPIGDLIEAVPGGGILLLGFLGVALGWLIWWMVQRRSGSAVRRTADWRLVDPELDPEELDVRAASAESAGDFSVAVRLRYEAGLIRLACAGRIELRQETTASGVAAQLADPALDGLTVTFEQVVYGALPAAEADAAAARDGWLQVLGARAS